MTYYNITTSTVKLAESYVRSNWVKSDEKNFLKNHIFARCAYLILAPASIITSAVDTIIGLGAAVGTICTFGKHTPTYNIAYKHISFSRNLIVGPYVNILRTINPKAKFTRNLEDECYAKRHFGTKPDYTPPLVSVDGDGFTSNLVKDPLKNKARSCYNSDNFLKRHISSRLTYALLAVSCIVTRAVDGIIGIPAAALSILTGGKFKTLNNLTFRALQAPAIIDDLFYCTIKFINPWTGTTLI